MYMMDVWYKYSSSWPRYWNFLCCQISALMGGRGSNGMLPNPLWIISIKDYGLWKFIGNFYVLWRSVQGQHVSFGPQTRNTTRWPHSLLTVLYFFFTPCFAFLPQQWGFLSGLLGTKGGQLWALTLRASRVEACTVTLSSSSQVVATDGLSSGSHEWALNFRQTEMIKQLCCSFSCTSFSTEMCA